VWLRKDGKYVKSSGFLETGNSIMALASVPTLLMIITNHVRTKSCLCGL